MGREKSIIIVKVSFLAAIRSLEEHCPVDEDKKDQYSVCYHYPCLILFYVSLSSQKIAKTVYSFFKELSSPTIVSGPHDFYIPILSCDVICFLTMVFGYSSFAVRQ